MSSLSTFNKIQQTEPLDKLIFQRVLGFKKQMLGSGQWYESSILAVPLKKHYKNECWICEKQIYSVLMWSRGRAFVLNPILPSDKSEKLRFEIDAESIYDEEPGLGHVKGNLSYEELQNKIPYIAGSFTGWRYKQMIPLHQFAMDIDHDYKDPIEIGKTEGKIRKKVTSVDQLLPDEKLYYDVISSDQRKKYRHHWARYLDKNLIFKKPYFINAG